MESLFTQAFPEKDSSILPVYHNVVEEIIFSVLKDSFDIEDRQLEQLKSELGNLFSPGAKNGDLPVFTKLLKAFILKNRAEFEAVVRVLQHLPAEFQTREFFDAFLTSLQNAYDAFSDDKQQNAVSALLVHVGANYGATAGKFNLSPKILIFFVIILAALFLTSRPDIRTYATIFGMSWLQPTVNQVKEEAICAKAGKKLYVFELKTTGEPEQMYFLLQPKSGGYIIIYLAKKFGLNEEEEVLEFFVKDKKISDMFSQNIENVVEVLFSSKKGEEEKSMIPVIINDNGFIEPQTERNEFSLPNKSPFRPAKKLLNLLEKMKSEKLYESNKTLINLFKSEEDVRNFKKYHVKEILKYILKNVKEILKNMFETLGFLGAKESLEENVSSDESEVEVSSDESEVELPNPLRSPSLQRLLLPKAARDVVKRASEATGKGNSNE